MSSCKLVLARVESTLLYPLWKRGCLSGLWFGTEVHHELFLQPARRRHWSITRLQSGSIAIQSSLEDTALPIRLAIPFSSSTDSTISASRKADTDTGVSSPDCFLTTASLPPRAAKSSQEGSATTQVGELDNAVVRPLCRAVGAGSY